MKVGRNEPCPCNSQKKYKNCCGAPGGKSERDWSGIGLALFGVIMLVGLLTMVVGAFQSDPMDTSDLVWSAEHGHWHTADGREVGAAAPSTPIPQPPGPAPEGKVWSPEHGHWHDL